MAYFKSYEEYRKALLEETDSPKESGQRKPLFNNVEEFRKALAQEPEQISVKQTYQESKPTLPLNVNTLNVLANPNNKNYFGNSPQLTNQPAVQKPNDWLYKTGKWATEGAMGVGLGALAAPFVAADNVQQTLANWQNDVANPEYMKRHAAFHQVGQEVQNDTAKQPYMAAPSPYMQGNTYTNALAMNQHSDQLKQAREQEILKKQQQEQKLIEASMKLDEVTDHTPVSMDTLGSQLMESSLVHKAKAVEDLEGPWRYLGEAALSMLDTFSSLPTAIIHPGLPLLIQSAKAGAVDMHQNNKAGLDPMDSMTQGVITAGIEFLTEKVGIDNLLDGFVKAPGSIREVVKRALRQGGIEASEEAMSSILSGLVSYEMSGGKTTDYSNLDLLKSAATGFLSGGMSSGVSGIVTMDHNQANITEGPNVLPTLENTEFIAKNEMNSNTLPLTDSKVIELIGDQRFNAVKNIAKNSNSKVEFIVAPTDLKGYYTDGTSYINVNAPNPLITTMSHEVVHHMKGTDQYDPLLNMAVDYVKSNYNYDAVINGIHEDYAKQGIQLDETGIQDELLAKFVEEKLFKDKTSIDRLIRENPNGFNKIYYLVKDNIQDTIKNATSTDEQRYLMNMENLYTKAMSVAQINTVNDANSSVVSYSIGKSFSDQVDDVLNGNFDKKNMVYVREPNDLMKKIFDNDYPILMTPKHVETTYHQSGKYKNANYHDLGEIVKQIPEALENPILVLKSQVKPNNAVFIVDLKNKNGSNLIVPIDVNTKSKYNNIFVDSNVLNTIYEKNSLSNMLLYAKEEDYLFVDNKKSRQLFLNQGLQLSNILKLNGFIHSIRKNNPLVYTSDENVNENMKEALKKAGLLNENYKSLGRSLSEYSQPNETVKVPGTEVEVKKPYKVARIEEITTNGFLRKLGKDFGISRPYMKNYKPMLQEITNDSIKNGKLNYNFVNQMFEDLWNQGVYLEDSIAKQSGNENLSKMISDYTLNEGQAKHALGEAGFEDFKKQHPRKLHFLANSTGIDVAYKELSEKYPRLFNPNLRKMDEQLHEIVKVKEMLDVEEKPLSGKSKLEHDYYQYEFQNDIGEYIDKMKKADAVYQSKIDAVLNSPYYDANTYKAAMENIASLERQRNKAMRNITMDDKDITAVKNMLDGTGTIKGYTAKEYDLAKLQKVYEIEKPLYDAKKARELGKKQIKKDYRDEAKELTEGINEWKEKEIGFQYKRETGERNFVDIAGTEQGQRLIDTLMRPTHENEAAKVRKANEYINEIKQLKLNRKESAIVQRHGEGLISDADVIAAGYDLTKIKNAENVMRRIYDELIDLMNEQLIRNGYLPIEKLDNYFLHMNEAAEDSFLVWFISKIGIKKNDNKLPTSIAGMTDTFVPGKAWFSSALHRTGDKTAYDAVKGIEAYINNSLNVIYHMEDIQRFRAFENEIRYQYSDDGMKERIDEIQQSSDNIEQAQTRIDELHANPGLGNLVSWLRSYTNTLANKQLFEDRAMEQNLGRRMYAVSKNAQSRVAANMVGANLSSAMTNFIPIVQATSQIKSKYLMQAMNDSTLNIFKDDGFSNDSTFLTNRKGIDKLLFTPVEKITKGMVAPMAYVDNFTSNVVVRAKYLQNIDKGMNEIDAMRDADAYAAKLIADRSKGAMPLLFEAKNPVYKLFTTFQLEVNNQLSYLFKDMKVYGKEEGMKALAMGLFNLIFWQWMYNNAYEFVAGRRPAMDVIDIAFSTFDDFKNPDLKPSKKLGNLAKEIAEDTPFIGSFIGGGRLPIQAAMWDSVKLAALMDSENEDVKEEALKSLLLQLLYLLPPAGGSQIKKTYEGLTAVNEAGVYKQYEDGKHLTYPVRQDLASTIQGGLFGKSSFDTAGNYYDSNEKVLSTKQTESYEDLVARGMDPVMAAYYLREIKKIKKNENGSLKENQSAYIEKLDIAEAYKKRIMETFDIDSKKYSNDINDLFDYYKSLQ